MVFVDIVLAACDDIYFIVEGAAVSLSFLINGILGLFLSDGLFFFVHSVLCRFSQFQFYMLCFNIGVLNVHLTGNLN